MLSSLDLFYIVKDLQFLLDSKVDKIYHNNRELVLQLHKEGKHLLKIISGSVVFITQSKEQFEQPTPFAMYLRKYLKNTKVKSISQIKFERIIEITFSNNLRLVAELFSKGNIILLDRDSLILNLLQKQKWKDRIINKNELYILPPERPDALNLDYEEFNNLIKKSNKENIVKVLAVDLGLSGKYAEELCFRAKIDKNSKDVDNKKLFNELQKIKKEKINPSLFDNDFSIIKLKHLKPQKEFNNIHECLEFYYSQFDTQKIELIKEKERLLELLEKQKEHIKELEEETEDFKKIGDLIYINYNLIDELIKTVLNSKWKCSNKLIKELKPAEKKIVIEL